MRAAGKPWRTIWAEDERTVGIIDQTKLPREFVTRRISYSDEMAEAISLMRVRGAPLIGVAGAYGVALALNENPEDGALDAACRMLASTRPTAINLSWAISRIASQVRALPPRNRAAAAFALAGEMAEEDVEVCMKLGRHGFEILKRAWSTRKKRDRLNILTHCNAGWLATVDWGTALAPIYRAHEEQLPVHVWVDETRPRNQGMLTAWELAQHGVPHTIIADNAGGHFMQRGMVDLCIVGTDRTTARGDVCNKIGTYLKALAAHDNSIPFYVAAPSSSIDFSLTEGLEIPIENRDAKEVHEVAGVRITPQGSEVANPAFDVTPAKYVTALITERGICPATTEGLAGLFPERAA